MRHPIVLLLIGFVLGAILGGKVLGPVLSKVGL